MTVFVNINHNNVVASNNKIYSILLSQSSSHIISSSRYMTHSHLRIRLSLYQY